MNNKKITAKMISRMSKQSLKSSRMRNIFVMITIVLASALLMAISMYAVGQQEDNQRKLSHAQEVGYYNLTNEQVETLKSDERIAYQIQVKMGTTSEMDGFEVIPYYVSELSDKIQIGELKSGKLPIQENEIAVQGAMLKKMGIEASVGSQLILKFYDGNTETFTVTGLLKGGENAKQFAAFFSQSYAESGSQLKDEPYEVYAKLYGATTMHSEDCKETMYLIGSDAGIERKYVSPSKAFLDSLSVDTQDVLKYGLIGIVILLACILVIYGVFYLSVIGKIHQFGQLRTIGMTKKQMKKLVSKEGRRLFLYASPIGILIGGIAGYFIIPSGFSIINTLIMAVVVFAVIYVITMISVHKPAKLAAAVSPMEALRYTAQDDMKKTANKKMCRNLTPLGLGVMNFSKNKKKAVITMLSLALGGILFMTAATFMSSFDKDNYARQGIWKEAEFHIEYSEAAIELNENSSLDGWFVMPEEAVKKFVPYESLNAHLLISVDTEKESTVGAALNEMISQRAELSLEAYADRKVAYAQTANTIFGTISGLAIFIMMFSILSMMNTLITNIVTRKQELAMLESIGMSKGQIRKMLLGESLLLVFVAVAVTMTIGTLLGYVLTHLLYNGGAFYISFKFPTVFVLAYTVVLIAVPLLITIVSMHSFSKEALVERLRGMEN